MRRTTDIIQDDHVIAEYRETRFSGGGDIGVDISRETEIAGGIRYGRVDADVRAGDPGLPEVGGVETPLVVRFLHDGRTVRSCRRAAPAAPSC